MSGIANFADISKSAIILIQTIFKDSVKVKRIKIYQNAIFVCVFLCKENC